jgi:DNA polymerase-1
VTVARTGRLSANDPPIQTIPRTGGLRGIFEPDVPHRDVFLSVDYSGIELRVMAWLANDEVMAPELINGTDLHRRMAVTAKLMRDPSEEEWERMGPEITKQERAIAKGVNFGIPYGRGAASIVDANPDAFPAKMIKQTRVEKVERVIAAYFEKYWGVKLYMERQVDIAKRRGYLRTYTVGRKRRFPGMDWFKSEMAQDCIYREMDLMHLEREAQNFQIQSIASDTLSQATKRCYDGIKEAGIPHFRIVMTLHDQLVFNCPRAHVEEAKNLILGWMECFLPKDKKHRYEMPLKVDCNIQRFWGEDEYE